MDKRAFDLCNEDQQKSRFLVKLKLETEHVISMI